MGSFLNSTLKFGLVFIPTDNAHIPLKFNLFYKSVFFNHVMEQTINSLLLDGCNKTTHSLLWAPADWKEMKRHNKNKILLEIQCCFHLNCSLRVPHQVPHQRSLVSVDWLSIFFFFSHWCIIPNVMANLHPKNYQLTLGGSPKQAVAHTVLFGWDTRFRKGGIELISLIE